MESINEQSGHRVELSNVKFGFDERLVLQDINILLEAGQKYVLCGQNGSGKTTLLRVLAGALTPNAGVIKYNQIITNSLQRYNDSTVNLIIPSALGFFSSLTVKENIKACANLIYSLKLNDSQVEDIIQRYCLEDLSKKVFSECSMGEKHWLHLVSSLSNPHSKLLLIDEPLNFLDNDKISIFLDRLGNSSKTIVFSAQKSFANLTQGFNALEMREKNVFVV